jgi:hypothetical protein
MTPTPKFRKFSKKQIALAVVMAVLGSTGVLFPEYVDIATNALTSLVNSGVFGE